MGENLLSGDEICKIIEACSKRRVSKLEFGPLKLDFQPPVHACVNKAPGPAQPDSNPENILREQEQKSKEAIEEEEIRLREEQIAELWLTNPAEAERLMELGELQPEASTEGPEDGS